MKLRALFFGIGCLQCVAIGQSVALRYWTDAADAVLGAIVFFGLFFALPRIRAFLANFPEPSA